MEIGHKDLIWNYTATFFKIASSVLLFPMILRMMPTETVGIWSIFITITAFSSLIDFGFGPSFTRNITYVFSGVKSLKVLGFEKVETDNLDIDYGLLKSVILAMKAIYLKFSLLLFFLLSTVGTYYIYTILQNYTGNLKEVYISWVILCLLNTYNLYTLYYDSLLQGKGMVKKSKQIIIVGQITYLIIASFFIILKFGLIAIVAAQASSILIVRLLSFNSFFTKDLRNCLENAIPKQKKDVLKAIYPNAYKIGLTSLGGFMVQRASIIIGSLYLPLSDIASYGITMQLITIIAGLSSIFLATFLPKIITYRVSNEIQKIKEVYIKGLFVLMLTYLFGGVGILIFGNYGLRFIESQTVLLPNLILLMALILSLEQTNLILAGNILLTKNEVPFYKSSLISGVLIIIGLLIYFNFYKINLWGMILVPLFIDFLYQAWKWPLEVKKDLNINRNDFILTLSNLKKIR